MDWLWWAQMGADVLILVAILLLIRRLRGGGGSADAGGWDASEVERFTREAGELSREFGALLDEKRELIGTLITALDRKLEQVRELTSEAEAAARALNQAKRGGGAPSIPLEDEPPTPPLAAQDFRGQVVSLVAQGLTPQEIAQRTGRPKGEVELMMGLAAHGD